MLFITSVIILEKTKKAQNTRILYFKCFVSTGILFLDNQS
ncbi:hypothetical protein D920_00872 [Enterococcus faecalis 13-SD-W-01]|nr:hypothetical protein D920_00872 [Enterococcus faecalis 13-SD-W-01]